MIESIRHHLRERALVHRHSREAVLKAQQQNFKTQLQRLDQAQKNFWFHTGTPTDVNDLQDMPLHTSAEIIATQTSNPPHGILPPGEMLFMSSGSTGSPRVRYYFSWDNWFEHLISETRCLIDYGVNESDTLMTADVGNMQIGYRHGEDSTSVACGGKIVKSGNTTWEQKIDMIDEYHVTMLLANTTKLKRLGQLVKSPEKVKSLRLVLQAGEHLSNEDQLLISKQFNVDRVVNLYGSVEMGLIFYVCPHGQQHVNEDLICATTKDNKTYFSKLISMPLFNLQSSEVVRYSYKGQCTCGSFLSTVDEFVPRTNIINQKE